MPELWKRLDSPRVALAVVAVAYGLFLHAYLAASDYDPSRLMEAADAFVDPTLARKGIFVIPGSTGYDGQFFYRLALNPFTSEQTELGVTLDTPAYRHQRILYPLIVWALSFGGQDAVPALLVFTNWVALCLSGWVAAHLAQSFGLHAVEGLALAFYPGFLFTLARDLSEIVAALFLLGGLLGLRRELHRLAAVLLALAVLTKETTVLLPVALGFVGLAGTFRKSLREIPWYVPAGPVLAFVGWQLLLRWNWGYWAVGAGGVNVGAPLSGLWPFVLGVAERATHKSGFGSSSWSSWLRSSSLSSWLCVRVAPRPGSRLAGCCTARWRSA